MTRPHKTLSTALALIFALAVAGCGSLYGDSTSSYTERQANWPKIAYSKGQ